MAITLNLPSQPSHEEIKGRIKVIFSQYKIKRALLTSNALMLCNGVSMVLVTFRARGGKISGGVYTANLGVAIGVGIGVPLGFIGSLIFFTHCVHGQSRYL